MVYLLLLFSYPLLLSIILNLVTLFQVAQFGIVYDIFDWTSFSSYFAWMSQNKLCRVCDHWKWSSYLFSCCLTLFFVSCFQMLKVVVQTTFSHTFVDQNSTLVLQIWILTQGKNHYVLLYSCDLFKDSTLFCIINSICTPEISF